jgi:hypothetical protein
MHQQEQQQEQQQERIKRDILPPVIDIMTPNLSDTESVALLDAINAVRSGEKDFQVLVTNNKVTGGRKRLAKVDYDPVEGLAPHAHLGWMTKAPTNKKGRVYIYIFDEARAQAGENGHTNISMDGIRSFRTLGERPGPHAPQRPNNAQALMADALYAQGQALILASQAMKQD